LVRNLYSVVAEAARKTVTASVTIHNLAVPLEPREE
jgi:hypothetical protein